VSEEKILAKLDCLITVCYNWHMQLNNFRLFAIAGALAALGTTATAQKTTSGAPDKYLRTTVPMLSSLYPNFPAEVVAVAEKSAEARTKYNASRSEARAKAEAARTAFETEIANPKGTVTTLLSKKLKYLSASVSDVFTADRPVSSADSEVLFAYLDWAKTMPSGSDNKAAARAFSKWSAATLAEFDLPKLDKVLLAESDKALKRREDGEMAEFNAIMKFGDETMKRDGEMLERMKTPIPPPAKKQ
jgi:hypothetical protein